MQLNAKNVKSHLVFDEKYKDFGKEAQVGYDLTLMGIKRIHAGSHMLSTSGSHVDKGSYEDLPKVTFPSDESKVWWTIDPGVYSLTFHQGCSLPDNVMALMGAVMIAHNPVVIEVGSRVAQITMSETQKSELYDGQYQDTKDLK